MGNCFSDPSKAESKGQKLGSGPSSTAATQSAPTSNKPTSKPTAGTRVTSVPPQTLGGGLTAVDNDGDARERALRAAEERAKAVSLVVRGRAIWTNCLSNVVYPLLGGRLRLALGQEERGEHVQPQSRAIVRQARCGPQSLVAASSPQ